MRRLLVYGQMCGSTLARAHGRSGDRIASALGAGNAFVLDRAIVHFAATYADQNERDYQALRKAVGNRVIASDESN